MGISPFVLSTGALAPALMMACMAGLTRLPALSTGLLWRLFVALSGAALAAVAAAFATGQTSSPVPGILRATPFALLLAVLVQLLATVIGRFSQRYLEGEPGQRRYLGALASVLAAVQVLLLADHWVLLIAAWAAVGMALQHLLCFYPERPFARLAAHKKRLADRAADLLLAAAAALAWQEAGDGSLATLWTHIAQHGVTPPLQACAVLLVLAVVLRTALLPVHGWLIQVMEAPTPVSALLHAGVVNLGGFVLIRFAPLLEQAAPARLVLLVFGLSTAVLAGMVMLTRVSIKLRLAWSTVAQMGFLLLECALGLFTLAALHLLGHSLYKAHAFLSASSVVRDTRRQHLHGSSVPSVASMMAAPLPACATVVAVVTLSGQMAWPWWWSVVLGLAWSPLFWLPAAPAGGYLLRTLAGGAMAAALTVAALLAHALPLGLHDAPHDALGLAALAGMAALFAGLVLLQRQPLWLSRWRRWSYAGFYVDEVYTRLALRLWPARWTPGPPSPAGGAILANGLH